jgi:hypothetical protein
VRAKGQAFGCFIHWFMCTLISWAFPAVAERAGTYAFGFFGLMMIGQIIFAIRWMPETKAARSRTSSTGWALHVVRI